MSAQPFPRRQTVDLCSETTINITNTGQVYANARFVPTNVYQWDPTGATSTPFLSELAGIYRFYRVRRFKAEIYASNREAFCLTAYATPVNYDPTANVSGYQQYLSSALTKMCHLSPATGASRTTLFLNVSVDNFGGARFTGTTDGYVGRTDGTGGGPTNNIYFMIGVRTDGSSLNGALGLSVSVKLRFVATFFELNSPAT